MTNMSIYVIVRCSNRRHPILCCHLQGAGAQSCDQAERQPLLQLVLFVSSSAFPPHNKGQQYSDQQYTVLFLVRGHGVYSTTGKQWVLVGVLRSLNIGKVKIWSVSFYSSDDAQWIKAQSCNVQSNYCNRLKYVLYSNLNSPVCKIWGNL